MSAREGTLGSWRHVVFSKRFYIFNQHYTGTGLMKLGTVLLQLAFLSGSNTKFRLENVW